MKRKDFTIINNPSSVNNNIYTGKLINPMEFTHNYTVPERFSTKPFQYTNTVSFVTMPTVRPETYVVDTHGDVYNRVTEKKLIPNIKFGYARVTLRREGDTPTWFLVHRLVAYQFCPIPIGVDFRKLTVNHINGNHFDNRCGNLEWISNAFNVQHEAEELHGGRERYEQIGRPEVSERFIRWICEQMQLGKTDTQIIKDAGMEKCNANSTFIHGIRARETWANISKDYTFNSSSKAHAYTKEERVAIANLLLQGKTAPEIFYIMQGREYIASIDRLTSANRTIGSIRESLVKHGRMN